MMPWFVAVMLSSTLPSGLSAASHVTWWQGDAVESRVCLVSEERTWTCDVPAGRSGLVIMAGDAGVACAVFGESGTPLNEPQVSRWGRLLVLETPGLEHDLRQVTLRAFHPENSPSVSQRRYFRPVEDPTFDILTASPSVRYVFGEQPRPDAVLMVGGEGVGSSLVATGALQTGPPDVPYRLSLPPPVAVAGRVETRQLVPVPGADVDLFMPLAATPPADGQQPPLLMLAHAVTDDDGAFGFGAVAPGVYELVVLHQVFGRNTLRIDSTPRPAIVRLIAPARVTGRVLADRTPALEALVRFVPELSLIVTRPDPRDLAVSDATTGEDGRFELLVPPGAEGEVMVTTADGRSIRVPVAVSADTAHLELGDLALNETVHVALRLLGAPWEGCDIVAVGPLQGLGVSVVHAAGTGDMYTLDLPEAGEWMVEASCAGRTYELLPRTIRAGRAGSSRVVDVERVE